jgi:alkylated DNA nucleotide flippase Atl1
MYLDNANTFRQMARLAGVNEANIARRIHKIIKRLIDGEYITCLRNREIFSNAEMVIAKQYLLLGWSIRKIASEQGCSYYRARKSLKKIQRLVQVIKADKGEKGRDKLCG